VVLVNVAGRAPGRIETSSSFASPPGWTELVPELDAQPDDHRVTKLRWVFPKLGETATTTEILDMLEKTR
jgi:hypothetical protein